jgi:hypothetical protein
LRPAAVRQHARPELQAGVTRGFDFTQHIRSLADDMCRRLAELAHIDLARVAIRFCQARKAVRHGIQASLTPLRFENGALTANRRGRTWTIQRIHDSAGREMLYLLSFYLPRYLELPWREKLATVIHELWHISPRFDGDLRRHPGRCYAHSHSQRQYDALVEQLLDKWLSLEPPGELFDFLQHGFHELERTRGPIYGLTIPTPKLIRAAGERLTG